MNFSKPRYHTASWVALFAVAGLIAGLVSVLSPSTANAAGRLSVSSELGGVTAAADGNTRFDVQGSGYQLIEGGFGGIYVAFGWVNERTWRPSQGGMTGTDYRYVPDSESKDNQGYLGFVAYPGSSTEGEAQAIMSDNGSWRLSLNVPGARFNAQDRNGNSVQVDCTRVTCGFMTFGAHGVKNANNEAFVPVTFQAGGGNSGGGSEATDGDGAAAGGGAPAARGAAERPQAAAGQARTRAAVQQQSSSRGGGAGADSTQSNGGGDGGADAAEGDEAGEEGAAATTGGGSATGAIEVTVDRAAARPGGALAYTAYGFWPGEQATVSLGQGIAAVGPLTTGVDGEIAGVITLPDDIDAGTYELRAVGAGSGLEGSVRFAISDVSLVSSEGGFSSSVKWEWVFFALAGLVFLAAVGFMVARRMTGDADYGDGPDGPDDANGPDGENSAVAAGHIEGVGEYYGTHSIYPAHSGH